MPSVWSFYFSLLHEQNLKKKKKTLPMRICVDEKFFLNLSFVFVAEFLWV